MPREMQYLRSKKIKILSNNYLLPLGGILGPILNTYRENIETIRQLVRDGYMVEEDTPDGGKVILNMNNYRIGNGGTYDTYDEDPDQGEEETPQDPHHPDPPVERPTYGKYSISEWENMYDDRTRSHYLYNKATVAKWSNGMKCVLKDSDNNFVQVYVCTTPHMSKGSLDKTKWRTPNSDEEAKLKWQKGSKPSSITQYEYDPLQDYPINTEVAWFNEDEGTWDIYKATMEKPKRGTLNNTKYGWQYLMSYYTDGTPKR